MTLQLDNKAAVDIFNSWSVSGQTRAEATRFAYVRELKEKGWLSIEWISTDKNEADLYMKNLDRATYEKHAAKFVGEDKYMQNGHPNQGGCQK